MSGTTHSPTFLPSQLTLSPLYLPQISTDLVASRYPCQPQTPWQFSSVLRTFCLDVLTASLGGRVCAGEHAVTVASFSLFHPMRRSTIKIHPNFSEAPHLRSSIPTVSHPKTDSSKKSSCIPMNTPIAQGHIYVMFRYKIGILTFLSQGDPSFRKHITENVLALDRRTRAMQEQNNRR